MKSTDFLGFKAMKKKIHAYRVKALNERLASKKAKLSDKEELDAIRSRIDKVESKLRPQSNKSTGGFLEGFNKVLDGLGEFGAGAEKVSEKMNENLLGIGAEPQKEKKKDDYMW